MKNPKYRIPRGICRFCGKEVALRCAGPDWLAYAIYPRIHRNKAGVKCEGSLHEIEDKDLRC